jgi:hypothetical protein
MSLNNTPRFGVLSCLISLDSETNLHLAHCLNFDLMECGPTAEDAWGNLKTSVKQYVEFCYTNHQEGLTVSADPEEWNEFAEALKHSQKPWKVDKISFDLKAPLPEFSAPIWMHGVSGDDGTCSSVQ